MENELLTADELGVKLHLKPETVICWARKGKIPAHRLSAKVIRFKMADVMAALNIGSQPQGAIS